MKPLNTQERNSSFWSFVLFFTLCVILITGAVSFNFILPNKQFTELKIKVKDYASFKAKQSGFMSQIDEINKKLKEYDMPGAAQSFLQKDISKKNIALEEAIGTENETNKVYHRIVENYNSMLSLKSKLSDAKVQLAQANSVLSDCESENRKVEKELKDKQEKK